MTRPRKIQGYGWRRDLPDPRDRIYTPPKGTIVAGAGALPGTVDLSEHMPPIYDQGQLGSCTANGIARCLEYEALRQSEHAVTPSRLFIYYGEREIEGSVQWDAGAEIRDGIKVVASQGAPSETDWPYDIGRFTERPPEVAYADALNHQAIEYQRIVVGGPGAPMRSAIASGLPIVFGFSVPASFEDGSWDPRAEPLPLPGAGAQFIGGHCVTISGYDFTRSRFNVPAFQCENSWGPGWGMSGRFWMDYRWFTPSRGLTDDLWVISRVE
jgi:C1A family cysteine protease